MDDANLKPDSERGGWDGWLSMRGQTTCGTPPCEEYGVRREGVFLRGFAWGGDVIGWLKFDPLCDFDGDGVATNNCGAGVTIDQISGPFDYAITVTPLEQTIIGLSPATLFITITRMQGWQSQDVALSVEDIPTGSNYTISPQNTCTTLQLKEIGDSCSRNLVISNLPYGDHEFKVVSKSNSPVVLADKVVPIIIHVDMPPPAPTVDIKANGSDGPITVAPGQKVKLEWTFDLKGTTLKNVNCSKAAQARKTIF